MTDGFRPSGSGSHHYEGADKVLVCNGYHAVTRMGYGIRVYGLPIPLVSVNDATDEAKGDIGNGPNCLLSKIGADDPSLQVERVCVDHESLGRGGECLCAP